MYLSIYVCIFLRKTLQYKNSLKNIIHFSHSRASARISSNRISQLWRVFIQSIYTIKFKYIYILCKKTVCGNSQYAQKIFEKYILCCQNAVYMNKIDYTELVPFIYVP